jgi:hypothetical protein
MLAALAQPVRGILAITNLTCKITHGMPPMPAATLTPLRQKGQILGASSTYMAMSSSGAWTIFTG